MQTIGDTAFQAETAILQSVTYDPATMTAALVGINNAVAAQNLSVDLSGIAHRWCSHRSLGPNDGTASSSVKSLTLKIRK